MKRAQAAQEAANLLHSAEESVFTALRDMSVLTAGLIDLRREVGVSPMVGQHALDRLAGVTAALHTSCSGIIAAHADLADVKMRVAGRVQLNGGMDKSPNESPVDGATGLAPASPAVAAALSLVA